MPEWWRGAVVYQVYPRSFADSNADGIGDLRGLLGRLEYIAGLGVDALWISPFFPSPMKDFGYDVADFCGVDPLFGTLDDFDAVVARAHELGLRVIIDQVYSHTSDQHPWFQVSRTARNSPLADWYVWADPRPDGSPPNNWQSLFAGSAWTWDARRGQYYLHNFLAEQPDLNVNNPAVQAALLEVARFWLERGVDGFRIDAVSHFTHDEQLRDNPPRSGGPRTRPVDFQQLLYNSDRPETLVFLSRLRAVIDAYPGRFSIGEIGGPDSATRSIAPYLAPGRLHTAYSFLFLLSAAPTPAFVRAAIGEWDRMHAGGWPTWVFSNHDAPRVTTRWGGAGSAVAHARLLNALLLSLRGSVCLYQGEELGLPQAQVPFERLRDPEALANWPRTLGRDGARTPLPWSATEPHAGFSAVEPWLPVDQRHLGLAVDLQSHDGASVLTWTRQLLALRRQHSALRTGAMEFLAAPPPLLAFVRRDAAGEVLCLLNLGDVPVEWQEARGRRWQPVIGSPTASIAPHSRVGLDAWGALFALPSV
jgi:alpha-glucosidase